jgi:hypothetical protein
MKNIRIRAETEQVLKSDILTLFPGWQGEQNYCEKIELQLHYLGKITTFGGDTPNTLPGYHADILCVDDFTAEFVSEIVSPSAPIHMFM